MNLSRVIPVLLLISLVQCQVWDYGVMIDAGSSSTKLFIYRWPHRYNPTVPLVETAYDSLTQTSATQKYVPDIVTLWKLDPSYVDAHLTTIMNYVKTVVPSYKWATTPMYFRATGGMRSLSQTDQTTILNLVRAHCKNDKFLFQDSYASVVTGADEGKWAWVTVNYLAGTLGNKTTFGSLDMGGSSTQIAFATTPAPLYDQYPVTFNNRNYTLYIYSYSNYGQDQALLKYKDVITHNAQDGDVINANCFLYGYSENYTNSLGNEFALVGTGNATACYDEVSKLIDKNADCTHTPCSFNGIYQPAVSNNQFYAFSGFYYTASFFFNSTVNVTLNQLLAAGSQYCSANWTTVTSQYSNVKSDYLKQYCFTANYFVSLLRDGYGINAASSQAIQFQGSLKNSELGWALGAMVYEANLLPYGPTNETAATTGQVTTTTTGVVNGTTTGGAGANVTTTGSTTSPDLSGFGDTGRKFDWAGAILGTFFGVLILIIFVLIVISGCYNDYKARTSGQV